MVLSATDFAGKTVVVTGGARGQGLSHAKEYARLGADVALIDAPPTPLASVPYPLSTVNDLRAAQEEVASQGPGEVLSFAVDVRDLDALKEVMRQTASEFGGIDVCVANAGVFSFAENAWSLGETAWRECVDTILYGSWATASAAIPHMFDRDGSNLVFIGSVSAHKAIAATAHYVAAKHGVLGLMRSFALELAPRGIRSNLVSPTATRTAMSTNPAMGECVVFQESLGSDMSNLLDVDMLEPHDVTEAVVWVSSEHARFVTGSELRVDAGFTVR